MTSLRSAAALLVLGLTASASAASAATLASYSAQAGAIFAITGAAFVGSGQDALGSIELVVDDAQTDDRVTPAGAGAGTAAGSAEAEVDAAIAEASAEGSVGAPGGAVQAEALRYGFFSLINLSADDIEISFDYAAVAESEAAAEAGAEAAAWASSLLAIDVGADFLYEFEWLAEAETDTLLGPIDPMGQSFSGASSFVLPGSDLAFIDMMTETAGFAGTDAAPVPLPGAAALLAAGLASLLGVGAARARRG